MNSRPKALAVFLSLRITELLEKGEMTDRYYNPGDLFDEVHFVFTNDDRPDPAALQHAVGSAKVFIHNFPSGKELFIKSLGYQPFLLRSYTREVLRRMKEIQPALIRVHGDYLNSYLALKVKQSLKIPYVVSLHTNPVDQLKVIARLWRERLQRQLMKSRIRKALLCADRILVVYQSIKDQLAKTGIRDNVEVAYNVLNPANLVPKKDFNLKDGIFRIVSVGRLIDLKNPKHIIRAVKPYDGIQLTFIGSGNLLSQTRELANNLEGPAEIIFIESMPNDELCKCLHNYDLFAVHSDAWEISKAVLEALLVGLPVVINRREHDEVPELGKGLVRLVNNTTDDYRDAILELKDNYEARKELALNGQQMAQNNWNPKVTEARFVQVYQDVMASSPLKDSF